MKFSKAALAAAVMGLAGGLMQRQPHHKIRASNSYNNKRGWGSQNIPGGGRQERERRMRQIAAGQLTRANGLTPEG